MHFFLTGVEFVARDNNVNDFSIHTALLSWKIKRKTQTPSGQDILCREFAVFANTLYRFEAVGDNKHSKITTDCVVSFLCLTIFICFNLRLTRIINALFC